MPDQTFPVLNVPLANGEPGDTSATTGGTNTFNPAALTGFCGVAAKNGPDNNIFLAFDLSAIPLGSVINAMNLAWTLSANGVGTGTFRAGFLLQDGTWEVSGFAAGSTGVNPFYNFAYQFPNTGAALPNASQSGTLAVESGILYLDNWADVGYGWDSGEFAGQRITYGRGFGGETKPLNQPFLERFSEVLSFLGYSVFGVTMDSQAPSATAQNRMQWFMTDSANSADHPTIRVDWTENPPVFTSTPPLFGSIFTLYTYAAVVNPWSLGDQTLGSRINVFYSLEISPPGMTIDSSTGLVSWTPASDQGGDHPVLIQGSNAGGSFVQQFYTLNIFPGGCVEGDPRARTAVSGSPEHEASVSGSPVNRLAVSGDPGHPDAVQATPVVTSAVSGVSRHCPKEN